MLSKDRFGIVSGMTGLSGVRGVDWYKLRKVKDQEVVRGLEVAVAAQSNPGTICGRQLDGTVNVGGLGGIPINPGTINVGDLQGGAYVAPTYQANSFSATPQVNIQGVLQDIITNIIVTNVPQDGSVARILWTFRKTGTTIWTPWAETPLSGLPNPPASQALSFAYGQLSNGVGYDFGLAYVSVRGETGAVSAFVTNYVAPNSGLAIPCQYLIKNRAWNPTFSGVGTTVNASANGISASVSLALTITNQPTDGSLSRISFFYRVTGTTTWSFYGSLPAVGLGLTTPPSSGAYTFTYADLTNGVGYDFALACEDAQGGETAVTYATNVTAQALVIGSPQLSSMPNTNAPNVSSITIGPPTINQSTFDETVSFHLDSVGTSQSPWLKEVELLVCAHGTNAWAHADDLGVKAASGGAGANYSGIARSLSGGSIYDYGVRYVDLQGNHSNVAFLGSNPIVDTPVSSGSQNLVSDSNFSHVTSGSAASNNGSANPYWQFYWIDGTSFYIGAGSATTGENYLGVRPGDSSRNCIACSEVIKVTAGQQYTASGYIDASTCSGSSPYLAIKSTEFGTEYARASQTPGQHGRVSVSWTCPAGVTQVVFVFASNTTTINSSILVFAEPMFQVGQLGPYKAGPNTAGPPPTTPPPSSSPPGDGGTGGGGTGSGGGAGTKPPTNPPRGPREYAIDGEIRFDAMPFQLINHFNKDTDINGHTLSAGSISAIHMLGGSGTNYSALFQGDDTLIHGFHSRGVQNALDSVGNILNVEFLGGKLQSDGSITNVDGISTVTQYSLTAGQPFSVSAEISNAAPAAAVGLCLGDHTNGYEVRITALGIYTLKSYVAGASTVLSTGPTIAIGTAPNAFRLSIIPGASNTLEASINGYTFPIVTDSSLTLTSGTWRVTVSTGGNSNAGKLLRYTVQPTWNHYSPLPLPIRKRIGFDNTLFVDGTTGPVSGTLPVLNHDTSIQNLQMKNRLINGNFNQNGNGVEASTFGWTVYGSPTHILNGTYTVSGTNYTSQQITPPVGNSAGIYQTIKVKPNTTYTYCVLSYVATIANGYARVFIGSPSLTSVYNQAGNNLQDPAPIGTPGAFYSAATARYGGYQNTIGSAWVLYSGTVTIPSGVTEIAFLLESQCGAGVNTNTYWQGAMFYEGNKYQDYVDGEAASVQFNTVDRRHAALGLNGPYSGGNLLVDTKFTGLTNSGSLAWGTYQASSGTWGGTNYFANGSAHYSYPNPGKSWFSLVQQAIGQVGVGLQPGLPMTISCEVWVNSGVAQLQWQDSVGGGGTVASSGVTSAPTLMSGTFTPSSSATWVLVKLVALNSTTETIDVYFWNPQAEYGTFPSPYNDHQISRVHWGNFDGNGYARASTFMNQQGSMGVVGGAPASLPYSSTSSSITLSLPAITFKRADQSTLPISAPTTQPSWSGLTASTTYYVVAGINTKTGQWYANLASSAFSGTQIVTNGVGVSGDGYFPVFVNATVATASTGNTGGGSGGGVQPNCPAVWQKVLTKERGYIRADEVEVGEHLPNVGGTWVKVIEALKMPAPIWTYTLSSEDGIFESFDVNDTHAMRTTDGDWVQVKNLVGGEKIIGERGTLLVTSATYVKDDYYIGFTVEGHEYTLGDALCHNVITY